MTWVTNVLIPKGGADFRGIGLLEPAWKSLENIMDERRQAIEIHDCIHSFQAGRGTGKATIEAKLVQQLVYIAQDPLYGVFLDLHKAYDLMDRGRCVEIMRAC